MGFVVLDVGIVKDSLFFVLYFFDLILIWGILDEEDEEVDSDIDDIDYRVIEESYEELVF